MHEVLTRTLDLLEPQIEDAGLTTSLCSDPEVRALGDPDRIGQIVLNLLANAVKFTPTGGRVDLSTEITDGTVRIRVADTGRGIPGSMD